MAQKEKEKGKGKETKKIWGLWQQPFFDEFFDECNNILLAGCGGGYDFMNTIPLFFALKHRCEKLGVTKNLYISNQSFSVLSDLENARRIGPVCYEIIPQTTRKTSINGKGNTWNIKEEHYFPELFLSQWFQAKQGLDVPIYTFSQGGVRPIYESYQLLVDELKLDCIILVDGGTDSLMFGNEPELGTPTEDMTSIAAVSMLSKELSHKYLVCIGMGIDTFHGVNHALFLENVGVLAKEGAFLGSFSLLAAHEEAKRFEEAYVTSQPDNSIVCSSVLSAVKGEFGNFHSPYTKSRTGSSKLFISQLMNLFWCFRLDALAKHVLYLDLIKETTEMKETSKIIYSFHAKNKSRKAGTIPY